MGDAYVTLTEAALIDYSDLAVKLQGGGGLAGSLPYDSRGWRMDREVVQPWRVTIVARSLTGLVNTTLVQNLNPPPIPPWLNADLDRYRDDRHGNGWQSAIPNSTTNISGLIGPKPWASNITS